MPTTEDRVASHYTTDALIQRIQGALGQLGIDISAATPADLKLVDEFHTGGLEATLDLLDQLEIGSATRVLDIGCGIGGTARAVTERYGCQVTGVDLTPAFVETAAALTDMVGLSGQTTFRQGSALALPVQDEGFDIALLLHVGMNIADKGTLFTEARRALCPGGHFAVFDVMTGPVAEGLAFPLPWSSVPETSFLAPPSAYRAAAEAAGFALIAERGRSDFAKAFFEKAFARVAAEGAPPLGIHILMGETAGEKLKNYVANLEAGRVAPTEMIFRAT
ncbi:MAG: class I SAM-dependent methyltransferase [Pseudomonadota bacterium]